MADTVSTEGKLLWQPDREFMEQSNLAHYMQWLARKHHLGFANYDELWQWSVDNLEFFWETVWEYFQIISHSPWKAVLSSNEMPGARWFEGATLNYAEHIFRNATEERPALLYENEQQPMQTMSWKELESKVAALAAYFESCGVNQGDRVVAFLPNSVEAAIGFMATASLGAVWSSCSPDFGFTSVIDRFRQIEPKVLIAVNGYWYNGKTFDKTQEVKDIVEALPAVEKLILVDYLGNTKGTGLPFETPWEEALATRYNGLEFRPVPFDHPIWVLYSSGTTGIPKAITQSHGGVLIEHLKLMALQCDCHPGDRFFWYSTTGWMMWNVVMAALLCGCTSILYDGSAGYPDLNRLWDLAARSQMTSMGISAGFVTACMKAGIDPGQHDLSGLKMIGSTGSPLPPEGFNWLYKKVKKDLWLVSLSGGTDVCSAFVGGSPLLPVYSGEIQCRALGCKVEAFNENGEPVIDEVGELVLTEPMPSMPVFFWNDPGNERYLSSYFEMYPGIWRHGDWVKITHRGSLVIYGRSDATLNRQGIRIGTSEIYRAIDELPEIADSLIIGLELDGGSSYYMPLFVKLAPGSKLDDTLKQKINRMIRIKFSPRHVPDDILEIPDVPYTLSGKKMETPVKRFLQGTPLEKALNRGSMRNPEAIDWFIQNRNRIIQKKA